MNDIQLARQILGAKNGDGIVELARNAVDLLREAIILLEEWNHTPFFSSRSKWEEWVSKFGPKVETLLLKPRL
jgi:hypothetical protein